MANETKTMALEKKGLTTAQMTVTALMTAVMCVLGPLALPIPVSPVPISLGSLVIYFMAYVLGAKLAVVSCAVYLLLGLVGLPVFTGFSGGLGKVAGPTGGYMIGYLFLAFIAGYFIERFPSNRALQAVGLILGTAVLYVFGTVWLSGQLNMTFLAGLGVGAVPYLPGDAAKIVLAVMFGPQIRKAVLQSASR